MFENQMSVQDDVNQIGFYYNNSTQFRTQHLR